MFDQIILALGGASFAAFGIWLMITPRALAAVDLNPLSPNARAEVRAMYGGLELGIAIFLLLCLRGPDLTQIGLHLQFLALVGLGGGRLIGVAIERFRVKRLILIFVALELIGAALTWFAIS